MKHVMMIASTMALVLAFAGAPITVQASTQGVPTEIWVTPYDQIADGCPYAAASWTVNLDGGTSGKYTVSVSYGDGYSPPPVQTNSTSIQWSYSFYDPTCSYHHYHEYWTASRGGGGTAHDNSYVTSN